MGLDAQRGVLEELGFDIVSSEPNELIGVAQRWHPDCVMTKLTYVVFVREVPRLTAAMIEEDRVGLEGRARSIDPSRLPKGFQKGVAVLVAYVAGAVDDDARRICSSKPKTRFAFFFLPGALDQSTGEAFYLRETPAWGAIFFSKFRFLMESVLMPPSVAGSWPISVGGAVLGVLMLLLFVASFALMLAR